MSEVVAQISRHLETALAGALTSIIGKRFSVSADRTEETTELEDPVIWEQSFSFSGEPALWLLAGRDLWREVGRLTLAAAGIDKPSDEDCRSTWHEILGQTMGAF
ncbi:MAG TPA: hypothetical protein VHB50_04690, partial [Bryobacteraceae bacterium]|nr:hypothetical protein [Bryobacteraceae bacterium]